MTRLSLPEQMETSRLHLARLRYEEAEELFYTYASKPEATRFLSWPTHRSVEDTRAFVRHARQAWEAGTEYSYSVRLKDSGRLAGCIGAVNDGGKIQFGYVLSPSLWGNGYATEMCSCLMAALKQEKSIYRIGTFVDAANHASIRVLEKSGLVAEARIEKWFRFINQSDEPRDCILFRLP